MRSSSGWHPGIVATATSSTFAFGLSQADIGGGAQNLIPITFVVIVANARIYGLSGGPVARALGVARTGPGGVLLVGSSPVRRAIGRVRQARRLTVLLWTANEEHVRAAEADGLAVYKSDPTQDATETAPPISTGSTMRSPSVTMTPSTRWSRPTSPSTSVAVTYSSSRPASGAASLRRARSIKTASPASVG